jgi:hypothetical protein
MIALARRRAVGVDEHPTAWLGVGCVGFAFRHPTADSRKTQAGCGLARKKKRRVLAEQTRRPSTGCRISEPRHFCATFNQGNTEMTDTPLIRMCGLFENTSKDGNTYFVGVAGGIKILVLRNKNAADGEPGWNLCFAARAEKAVTASEPAAAGCRSKARSPRPTTRSRPDPGKSRVGPMLNDELPPWLG